MDGTSGCVKNGRDGLIQNNCFTSPGYYKLTADLPSLGEAANDNGRPSELIRNYRYQTALTSGRLCLITDIGDHLPQRCLAGYFRGKTYDKVHVHIESAIDSIPRT